MVQDLEHQVHTEQYLGFFSSKNFKQTTYNCRRRKANKRFLHVKDLTKAIIKAAYSKKIEKFKILQVARK